MGYQSNAPLWMVHVSKEHVQSLPCVSDTLRECKLHSYKREVEGEMAQGKPKRSALYDTYYSSIVLFSTIIYYAAA
jgi:hypothetical protein